LPQHPSQPQQPQQPQQQQQQPQPMLQQALTQLPSLPQQHAAAAGADPNVHFFPKLFVAGLARNTTEPMLYQIFAPFGLVREVVILRHATDGASKMCGFVRFSALEEAQRAIMSLSDRVRLPGSSRALVVTMAGHARQEAKLYVGHLPLGSTDESVHALFAPYGQVTEVHLMRDAGTRLVKGSGFVKFALKAQAEAAIGALNNAVLAPGLPPLAVSIAREKRLNDV